MHSVPRDLFKNTSNNGDSAFERSMCESYKNETIEKYILSMFFMITI